MFPVRPIAGTDRALLESKPSSPDGAIGSQKGKAESFLRTILATGAAPNCSFLADGLFRCFAFKRSVSNVRSHALKHLSELLHEPLKRGSKPRRRWQHKGYGDLLQHDSSPHHWWPGEISFPERRWGITPGESKQVTIVQLPGSFRVIARPRHRNRTGRTMTMLSGN